jgi:hypothetical protein
MPTRMHQLKDLWNTFKQVLNTSQGSVAPYVMKEKNDSMGRSVWYFGFLKVSIDMCY